MSKATGPLYKVHFRRRREQKTNYAKRLALLKSGKPRLVARKSNKYFYIQIISYSLKGDCVVAASSSRELSAYGFKGKCNTPSAYLTGLLAGRKALNQGVKEMVFDIGLYPASKGGIVFAALQGALDAGLKTNFSQDVLPKIERIEGKHLSAQTQKEFVDAKKKILEQVISK